MTLLIALLLTLTLSATTSWADISLEKDDTFPSGASLSTKRENEGPWRIVMLDRDDNIVTATFYITSVKPMAFDKNKNGVFTIDGVNLPAKLVSSKKTTMTDYSLAAAQYDLSPLKEQLVAAKSITVTCFFNTGLVVTWEVPPEVIEEWRVLFLLPEKAKPLQKMEQAPAAPPGAGKPGPGKTPPAAPKKPEKKQPSPAPAQPAAAQPAPAAPAVPAEQKPEKPQAEEKAQNSNVAEPKASPAPASAPPAPAASS